MKEQSPSFTHCTARDNKTGEQWQVDFDDKNGLTYQQAKALIDQWNRAQVNHKNEVTYFLT